MQIFKHPNGDSSIRVFPGLVIEYELLSSKDKQVVSYSHSSKIDFDNRIENLKRQGWFPTLEEIVPDPGSPLNRTMGLFRQKSA